MQIDANSSATMTKMPVEILQNIFAHITPTRVLQFRRLCRAINSTLCAPYFAVLNLSRHIIHQNTAGASKNSYGPTDFDRAWCHWPLTYQAYYVKTCLVHVESITWYSKNMAGCSIAESIGGLHCLTFLSLSNNKLRGRIPASLGSVQNLEYCYLDGNSLDGEIPNEICRLEKLRDLQISNNCFEGAIPDGIGQLVSLRHLDLSRNKLSGKIPASIGELVLLQMVNLGYNRLEGEIPENVGKLTDLKEMNFEKNQLFGIIPKSLEQLTRLESLVLRGNGFYEAPSFLNILPSLKKWNIVDGKK